MQRMWADRLFCFGASATLLLLAAAEGKVWPWLLEPPVEEQTQDASPDVDAVTGIPPLDPTAADPEKESGRADSVRSILPDGVPVRSPLGVARHAWLTARGATGEALVAGPLRPLPNSAFAIVATDPAIWQLRPRCCSASLPARLLAQPTADPCIGTVLIPTGPPRLMFDSA